jgi:catechol 2,3-dioxygenase-like lactoylglutathione lyase family enzyme
MKRLHVHIAVTNLAESMRFYTTLFGIDPTVAQVDYAKWMLDDPRVNFAISQRGAKAGLDHLGIQVDSDEELEALNQQFIKAALPVQEQKQAACCYSRSNKYWTLDPQGIAWETYHSLEAIPLFGGDVVPVQASQIKTACCPSAVNNNGS